MKRIDLDDYNWLTQQVARSEPAHVEGEALAPILVEYFNPQSVIDLGCGPGRYIWPLWHTYGLEVHGVDGCPKAANYGPIEIFDLREPYHPRKRYNLCVCIEVLEHIEPEFAQVIVDSIARCADVAFVTAATPGQGGEHHVNEQPREYWIDKFSGAGMDYDEALTDKLRGLFEQDEAFHAHGWLITNTMIFRIKRGKMKILQVIDQMGIGGIQEHIRLLAEYSMHEHAVRAYMGPIGEEMFARGFWVSTGFPPDIEDYDIIQAHTVGGWRNTILQWGKERGMKTVEVLHGNAPSITPPEWVDALVCLNGIAYELNRERFPNSMVFPVMVEYDKLPKKPPGSLIGRISRVVEEKRPDHFIEVARRCPDLEFVLGGDGSMLEELKRRAPPNVHFSGMTRDLPGFYQNLKVFLYPTKDDCCSAVVAMALASGIPVVTYDIPSMQDVFGDLVWYAQGLDDLHLVLRHVLGWNAQVQDKIERGLEFAKKFDVWGVSRQFDQLYQDLYGAYDEKSIASYWDLRVWEFINTPYDGVASFGVSPSSVPGAQAGFRERYTHLFECLNQQSEPRLLDVGCGIGHYSVPLQEMVPGLQYHGIDTSPLAVQYALEHFCPECVVRVASATEIPFADDYFDAVMSITCLQHLSASMQLRAIAEMRRVLKPGGLVVVREDPNGGAPDMTAMGEGKWRVAWGPEVKLKRNAWEGSYAEDVWTGRKR